MRINQVKEWMSKECVWRKIVRAGSEDFSKNGKTTVVEIKVRYSFGVVFSDLYIGDTTLIITHHYK